MEIVLLGTGGADGWPNPFCTCASCRAAAATGELRGQTAALVDDRLLLDCGPEVPRAALQLGRSLAGVRHLLLTHAHPDHTGPAALMWRGWAGAREPLDVVGPPAALAVCRSWVEPDAPLVWHEVRPGDRLTVGEYDVRVLAARHSDERVGPAVLYDLTGPGGARLLYATDTAALPEATLAATAGAAYDAVLLEETFGDRPEPGVDHLDLATFPLQLAALRRRGAIVDRTRVVAIHLGHRNPPTVELAERLRPWGAEVLPDGARLVLGAGQAPAAAGPPAPCRVLVLGGARSGKSLAAEQRLLAEPAVSYVATGATGADDQDWQARVAAHAARRPAHWRTLETTELALVLREEPGPLLVDCLTLWLTAALDAAGWGDVTPAVDDLLAAWRGTAAHVVAVSNEVGSGVHPPTAAGRRFRDELGRLNARLAAEADEVWLVTAGIPRRLR